jgi:DNA (cytosine-5)-methyltransferase 1
MSSTVKKRDSAEITRIMRRVRSSDTTPEVTFRKALWSHGIRYKKTVNHLPGKPDIVIPSKQIAIFIDGDYWHGGQWRNRSLRSLEEQFGSTTSRAYWLQKIRRNMERDCRATSQLLSAGWAVLRFWESQLKHDLEGCLQMTLSLAKSGASSDTRSILPYKTCAEFFAGIGLMRMGLERQGWSVNWANDIDPEKHEMYRTHFGPVGCHFVEDDIHNISAQDVPSVTLATASFPCTDLSLAGAREGLDGEHSSAFWGFIRILKEMKDRKPPIVLLENVTGFLSSHKGKDFASALAALNEIGYAVDAFILDAARFVPQSRQRLFILGTLKPLCTSQPVREGLSFFESDVRPKALAEFIFAHDEIDWTLRDLPSQPRGEHILEDILEDYPHDSSVWWSPERANYLLNQMSEKHREIAEEMISQQVYSYGTVFRRIRKERSMAELRTDGIAGCLRTPKGGSGRQILFKAGRGKYFARLLSARECARLMGADDYQMEVPLNQALFGFGDAVCVPVVEWIAKYYLNPLVNEMIRGQVLHSPKVGVEYVLAR